MKLKIIKPSRWEVSKNHITSYILEQIISVPEDVPQTIANDMLRCGYAVLVEEDSAESQRDLLKAKPVAAPENKAVEQPVENKGGLTNAVKLAIEEMTRKELIHFAKAKSIKIGLLWSKAQIKEEILKGGL